MQCFVDAEDQRHSLQMIGIQAGILWCLLPTPIGGIRHPEQKSSFTLFQTLIPTMAFTHFGKAHSLPQDVMENIREFASDKHEPTPTATSFKEVRRWERWEGHAVIYYEYDRTARMRIQFWIDPGTWEIPDNARNCWAVSGMPLHGLREMKKKRRDMAGTL